MISVIMPIYILDKELEFLTRQAIDSLVGDYELIIIDNNSPIRMDIDCDILIRNKENLGNGKAWNQGLKIATGEHILLTDNDVKYSENWQELVSNKKEIVFPLSKCSEDYEFKPKLSGFSWMINRQVLKEVGYISEDYGIANFEDTDYFRRAMIKGVDLACDHRVKVEHIGRATCDKVPEVKEIYKKNKAIYESKFGSEYPYLTV